MELLPAIDILDGKAVRLAKGDYNQVTVYNDDPVDQAQRFEQQGADWIHVVDLNGARSGRPEHIALIEKIMRKTLLKVEVGGGIRSMDVLNHYYEAGVSRTVLGTALVTDSVFAEEAYSRFGGMICAGIDAKDGEVAVAGWCEGAGVPVDTLAKQMREVGIQHLVYTDISRDGMQTGVEADAYRHMAEVFGHPVIASGGVSGMDDLRNLAQAAEDIEGVIAGRAIYEGSLDVEEGIKFCRDATRKALAALVADDPCGTGGLPC